MKKLVSFAFLAMALVSCSTSSRITSTWRKPSFPTGYNDVIVTALTPGVETKTSIENDMASALIARNIGVSKGMDLFPPSFSKDTKKEEMMEAIRKTTAKAIITVSLIHKETSARYVPGTYGYAPTFTYYGRFWGYYSYWYPTIYSQGYYTQDNVYYMETNVYDAVSEELVWSAQSESYNPDDMSGFSTELAGMITDKLIKDGVVRPMRLKNPNKDLTSKRAATK